MRQSIHKLLNTALGVVCLLSFGGLTAGLWAGPAQAAIFFDDSFEGVSPEASGWGYTASYCSGSPCPFLDVSTTQAHAGSQSVKLTYSFADSPNQANDNVVINTTAIWRSIPQRTEVYNRYWYRTTGFTYGAIGTKNIYWRTYQTRYPNFVSVHMWGSRELGFAGTVLADCNFNSCNLPPNIPPPKPLADNTWYCIEEHVKLNDIGVANGLIEIWVDGVQTLGYYNRTFRGTAVNGPNGNSSSTVFNSFQIYKQIGDGLMYYDQFAVGDTRIGCGGSPPPVPTTDTTPPTPPSGLDAS